MFKRLAVVVAALGVFLMAGTAGASIIFDNGPVFTVQTGTNPSFNLTTMAGTNGDWIDFRGTAGSPGTFDFTTCEKKNLATHLFGNLARAGGSFWGAGASVGTWSWSDGTANASGSDQTGFGEQPANHASMSFTVLADQNVRTLTFWAGLWNTAAPGTVVYIGQDATPGTPSFGWYGDTGNIMATGYYADPSGLNTTTKPSLTQYSVQYHSSLASGTELLTISVQNNESAGFRLLAATVTEGEPSGNLTPEPGTMLLVSTGVFGAFGVIRRRRMK